MTLEETCLWWLMELGLPMFEESGDEVFYSCLCCGKGTRHCGYNRRKRVFNCFCCGASGTYLDLQAQLVLDLAKDIRVSQLRKLARNRRLPTPPAKLPPVSSTLERNPAILALAGQDDRLSFDLRERQRSS